MRSSTRKARDMRKAMSRHEAWLWTRLRRLRERGYHIRRQVPHRGYFLDFACLSHRLVIEVDGSQHQDDRQAEHDYVRDKILARDGFKTRRFTTAQINEDVVAIMDTIIGELEARGGMSRRPSEARRLL